MIEEDNYNQAIHTDNNKYGAYEPNSDIEIDKYMNLVENELKKFGQTLNDSLFISQIIIDLDKLSAPKTFNKTLFFHIIQYANFDINKPIKLLNFFRAFFSVYESMKKNRDAFALETIDMKNKIEALQKKLLIEKGNEILYHDGITSNSSLQYIYKRVKSEDDGNIREIAIRLGNLKKNISIDGTYSKDSIPVKDIGMIELPLYINVKTDQEEKCVDTINVKNILETPLTRVYPYFTITFLWVNSLVSYINKRINIYEFQGSKSKEGINVLNTSINQMEEIFKNYFSQVPRSQYSNIIGGTMGNELEVSEKIEQIVLKTVGREIILWDTIAFILNKVLMVLILVQFVNRFDMISLICGSFLLGIELKIVYRTNNLYKLLIGYALSMLIDVIYLVKGFGEWGCKLPYDVPVIGKMSRLVSVCLCIAEVLLKIIIMFSLWRMALEEKLISINKAMKQRSDLSNDNGYNRKKTKATIPMDMMMNQNQNRNEVNLRMNTYDEFY